MPLLETDRLTIRPFVAEDLDAVHELLSLAFNRSFDPTEAAARAWRQRWLEWAVLNEEMLAALGQPPYGDRAVIVKTTGQLIGSVGCVPCLDFFGQLPSLQAELGVGVTSTEFGLFWACHPAYQRRGYLSEAARALVDYAFDVLKLRRVVATTERDNVASIGVMRKLGMRVERNPLPEPPWLQVVGLLDHPPGPRD
jgi:RimJ/RimL family protein N-acetyltransferase